MANTPLLAVATTLMIAGIIAMNAQPAAAVAAPPRQASPPLPPAGDDAFSNMFGFIKDCALYMHISSPKMLKPNEKCCTSLKKVDVLQFCKTFFIPNTNSEKVFSPTNVARVAKTCNSPLPLNSKCGSYIVKENPSSMEEQLSQ